MSIRLVGAPFLLAILESLEPQNGLEECVTF